MNARASIPMGTRCCAPSGSPKANIDGTGAAYVIDSANVRSGKISGRHAARPCRNAFTLIEILIAVSIMTILLITIHVAFLSALKLRNTTEAAIERTMPVELALRTLRRDLANLIVSTNGTLIGPMITMNPTNSLPGQIGPDFYTTGGELDGLVPWGNIEKIDYALSAPTNGGTGPGQDLVRFITRNLLPVNQQPMPEEREVLLTGVQSLTFQYYDGAQWDPNWDTTQQTNLPVAIKVQIQMAAPSSGGLIAGQPLELVVPVDVLLNTNLTTALQ